MAILATDGVEQRELLQPRRALLDAGARVEVVSLDSGTIQGYEHDRKGDSIKVDTLLSAANPASYDALVLPGGVANPDRLRILPAAIAFVRAFVVANKPIAAICHGAWTLIDAGGVRGKRMTSWPSLRTDLTNAGALWVDQEVVTDGRLVTSRRPADLPAFNEKMLELFAQPAGDEPRNEGEGNKSADRQYREQAREFAEQHDVEALGRAARREVEEDEAVYRAAEAAGKQRMAEEDRELYTKGEEGKD